MSILDYATLEQRSDMTTDQKRLWRALIRVEDLDLKNGTIDLVLPGSLIESAVRYETRDLPPEFIKEVETAVAKPYRFYARMNLGAESPEQVYIAFETRERPRMQRKDDGIDHLKKYRRA